MNEQATTHTATGDLSNVAALTGDQLAAELAAARARFTAARVNDPRRVTLAYSDSKFAVQVLTAEQRRRTAEQATTTDGAEAADSGDVEVPGGPCGDACRNALAAHCECACAGTNHGVAHRFGITSKPLPRRDPFAGIAAPVDDLFGTGVTYNTDLGAFVR